jgi:DNA-binding NarL/FixJ family response regulator
VCDREGILCVTAGIWEYCEGQFAKEVIMKIMLADHHSQTLWALKTMLQEKSQFEVIGDAMDAYNLLNLVIENPPDLVLMDSELPGMSNAHLITELHKVKPKPVVVVMGTSAAQGTMLIKAGADAYINKSDPPDRMLEILEKFEREYHKS